MAAGPASRQPSSGGTPREEHSSGAAEDGRAAQPIFFHLITGVSVPVVAVPLSAHAAGRALSQIESLNPDYRNGATFRSLRCPPSAVR
jgi:hypothetical protein